MSNPPVPVSGNRGDAKPDIRRQSALYKVVMTPIIFVSFVISLAIVDLKYTMHRSHYHAERRPSRLPPWLHRIVYKYRPYHYTAVDENGKPVENMDGYYHSKQRKLMAMEADDAFQMRRTVVASLVLAGMVAIWGAWWTLRWVLGKVCWV
ncbi:hypothetical protein GE21DRAFT_1051 [Neurospora crassa]|uniref:Uncharacterized protein n=1 Tax=Neurospora crassa (strain ATCC 24698 / 74-OR23-1A / CBS 708.71 / DSM 1257 / FGSC 987) TaxID=367110 RepID=Q7SD55_NEUCR|nr:hypothetical protein NCU09330 [Neurospora crassa OR74A]EAA34688.1 hypothetical protein NCU09330 [Neurospora crassa OR74A]KHE83253.1 hypothetical protein GE21DRAFT_1051 [Neurospora crassa]|eukprot:XP_963924.1 hypothetical protein NCU09330 [Neurospora crassa OR74A]